MIAALPPFVDRTWLVCGLPRGGVPIAAAIARHLGAQLDVLIVRKVGAPANPELAVAAVTGPRDDQIVINKAVQRLYGLTDADIHALAIQPAKDVEARRRMWAQDDAPTTVSGRDILIVDDGAATGTTLAAAIAAARQQGARRIIAVIPVALQGALTHLHASDVQVICLHHPDHLSSVGEAYQQFPQVSDVQVADFLSTARRIK